MSYINQILEIHSLQPQYHDSDIQALGLSRSPKNPTNSSQNKNEGINNDRGGSGGQREAENPL